jgi:predicted dehydrogenase
MCIAESEARAMIAARDASQAQVMVGYMRRFAPAYLQALEEVKTLGSINYARIRGIIGPNRYFTSQTTIKTYRFDDLPPEAAQARHEKHKRLMREALGEEATADHFAEYGLLLGLNSHDISVMRELLGMPKAVTAAASWLGGRFKSAILEFDGYHAMFETGIDDQGLFDAHIEIYGDRKSLLVQYDTPYLRQLPTTLRIRETHGDGFKETVVRPSYKDAYAYELEYFHRVVTEGLSPKTTPEDYLEDLAVFRMIMNAIRKTEPTGHE